MGKLPGPPPIPNEIKRRRGNPGKRTLPDTTTLTVLPGSKQPMASPLPLGPLGQQTWDTIWKAAYTWVAESDRIALAMLCQALDERDSLRALLEESGDWRDRIGLRKLDGQIMDGLARFGFTPADRTRLGVAEVRVDDLEAFKKARRA